MNLKTIAAVVGIGIGGAIFSNANQTINWSANVISVFYDSAGGSFPDSWTIDLGVFTDPFDPDENNTADWSSNFVVLDTTNLNLGTPPFASFASSVVISDTALADMQLYMWFYNNQLGDETSEWALVTDSSWTVGTEAELLAGQGGPTDTYVLQTGTDVRWGGLNDTPSTGGIRSNDPGTYDLQTHTFPPPIPEPSVLLGLAMSLLFFGGRRSRRS